MTKRHELRRHTMEAEVSLRDEMVEKQLRARGITDMRVLEAMRDVPREHFVGIELAEFAYDDTPLPIEEGQTISQPYIVAAMIQAAEVNPGDKVLEIGTGSGYAAAVLSKVADDVYTVERIKSLALLSTERYLKYGYDNIHVLHGDGTLGWPENAPFNVIIVSAGGPEVPQTLIEQLAVGGRLVIPAGESPRQQTLLRIRRKSETEVAQEDLGQVRFVPLIGAAGWEGPGAGEEFSPRPAIMLEAKPIVWRIRDAAEAFESIEEANLNPLMSRVADARVVLLGEASHGTADFYNMRARITKALIEEKSFKIVAVECDWPDAAQIDHFVRDTRVEPTEEPTFHRFPTWMWANMEVLNFVTWLRQYNQKHFSNPDDAAGFYGLDLYSLFSSIHAVVNYLDTVDPQAANVARTRYSSLTPWEKDPAAYGASAISGKFRSCESDVAVMLNDLMNKRLEYAKKDGRRFLDASSNARLVQNAERYYRIMYFGSAASWNLRDQHMFDTLQELLEFHGPESKAVVWAHNSHIGNAQATEMSARGEHNIGMLCRQAYGDAMYNIGFGTHEGVVAAASEWGGPMELKRVRPSHPDSFERLCHDAGIPRFMLPLRTADPALIEKLQRPRLERAIGVIYHPETELYSHYFQASLSKQFDEYIWFDQTEPVSPLGPESGEGLPDTFPFGL